MLAFMGILLVSYSFYTEDTSRVVEVPLQNLLNSAGCPLYTAAVKTFGTGGNNQQCSSSYSMRSSAGWCSL